MELLLELHGRRKHGKHGERDEARRVRNVERQDKAATFITNPIPPDATLTYRSNIDFL